MQPPSAPSRQSPQDGLVLTFSICQVCEEEVPELDPISLARLLSLTSPNGSLLIRPLYLLLYNTEDSSSQVYFLCCKITKVKTVIFRPLPHIALHCPILPYIVVHCRSSHYLFFNSFFYLFCPPNDRLWPVGCNIRTDWPVVKDNKKPANEYYFKCGYKNIK